MFRTNSKEFEEEKILSVVFDRDLGLCIELGDEKLDDDGIYGYAPTQVFVEMLKKEIEFHLGNTIGGLSEHPTLRRIHRRFLQGLEKRRQLSNEPPTSKIAWSSFPEDPHVALKEVGKMLGLGEDQLALLLALLARTDDGHLCFHVGNVRAEFFINYSILDDKKGIVLEIEVERDEVTHSVTYRIMSKTLGS